MKKRLALLVVVMFLAGCDGAPTHQVYGNKEMRVYSVKESSHDKGKYEYWITDESLGWMLRTDEVFSIGDVVLIKTD